MSNVLIVAAHPDDETLGMGGTILTHVQKGDKVYCLILADGISSRYYPLKRKSHQQNEIEQREYQAVKVSDLLHIEQIEFCSFPDQRLDTLPLLVITKSIEQMKADVLPNIVYTHFEYDLNLDHRVAYQATMTAFRPLPVNSFTTYPCSEIYSFEIPSSTEWSSVQFNPNIFVSLSLNQLTTKIEALKLYEDELRPYPHPRSIEAIIMRSRYWGSVCGHEYAEAFKLIRQIKGEVDR